MIDWNTENFPIMVDVTVDDGSKTFWTVNEMQPGVANFIQRTKDAAPWDADGVGGDAICITVVSALSEYLVWDDEQRNRVWVREANRRTG